MAYDKDEVISCLNDLIETCRDGENGFRQSAEGVKDPELRSQFNQYSDQREEFARELQMEVSRLGGDPADSGSVAGAAHRGWLNIKSAITGGSDKAVVSEAERGEDTAVRSYQNALARDLPSDVRAIVERQYRHVKATHDHVRSLERQFESRETTGTAPRTSRAGSSSDDIII